MIDHESNEWDDWQAAEDNEWLASLIDDDDWRGHVRTYSGWRDRLGAWLEKYAIYLGLIAFAGVALLSRLVIDYGAVAHAVGRFVGDFVKYNGKR